MTSLQLNPPIEVFVPEKGYGWALAHIDYGPGLNGVFLVALEDPRSFLYVDITLCKPAENFAFNLKKPA